MDARHPACGRAESDLVRVDGRLSLEGHPAGIRVLWRNRSATLEAVAGTRCVAACASPIVVAASSTWLPTCISTQDRGKITSADVLKPALGRFRRLARDNERLAETLKHYHWLAFLELLLA